MSFVEYPEFSSSSMVCAKVVGVVDKRGNETSKSLATDDGELITHCISVECKRRFRLFTSPSMLNAGKQQVKRRSAKPVAPSYPAGLSNLKKWTPPNRSTASLAFRRVSCPDFSEIHLWSSSKRTLPGARIGERLCAALRANLTKHHVIPAWLPRRRFHYLLISQCFSVWHESGNRQGKEEKYNKEKPSRFKPARKLQEERS